jgi:hypothetical protein
MTTHTKYADMRTRLGKGWLGASRPNRRNPLSIIVAIALLGTRPEAAGAQSCPGDTVTRQELGEAMRAARLTPGGAYSLLATTNSARFQSAVFQHLIERAMERRPTGGTLVIPYDALWWEFLIVAGIGAGEEGRAPIGRRLAFDYHQSIDVSYGPPEDVVRLIKRGPAPRLAANVRLYWADRPDGVRKYSFSDTLSVPQLKVTNYQEETFRFLVFDGMTVLDDIEGISGRPLTGLLGAIFKIIGEGDAVFARFALSEDGSQVVRAKSKKLISKTVTATINPDGTGQSGLPDGRADLVELETRLKQPLEFEYRPYRCWSAPE